MKQILVLLLTLSLILTQTPSLAEGASGFVTINNTSNKEVLVVACQTTSPELFTENQAMLAKPGTSKHELFVTPGMFTIKIFPSDLYVATTAKGLSQETNWCSDKYNSIYNTNSEINDGSTFEVTSSMVGLYDTVKFVQTKFESSLEKIKLDTIVKLTIPRELTRKGYTNYPKLTLDTLREMCVDGKLVSGEEFITKGQIISLQVPDNRTSAKAKCGTANPNEVVNNVQIGVTNDIHFVLNPANKNIVSSPDLTYTRVTEKYSAGDESINRDLLTTICINGKYLKYTQWYPEYSNFNNQEVLDAIVDGPNVIIKPNYASQNCTDIGQTKTTLNVVKANIKGIMITYDSPTSIMVDQVLTSSTIRDSIEYENAEFRKSIIANICVNSNLVNATNGLLDNSQLLAAIVEGKNNIYIPNNGACVLTTQNKSEIIIDKASFKFLDVNITDFTSPFSDNNNAQYIQFKDPSIPNSIVATSKPKVFLAIPYNEEKIITGLCVNGVFKPYDAENYITLEPGAYKFKLADSNNNCNSELYKEISFTLAALNELTLAPMFEFVGNNVVPSPTMPVKTTGSTTPRTGGENYILISAISLLILGLLLSNKKSRYTLLILASVVSITGSLVYAAPLPIVLKYIGTNSTIGGYDPVKFIAIMDTKDSTLHSYNGLIKPESLASTIKIAVAFSVIIDIMQGKYNLDSPTPLPAVALGNGEYGATVSKNFEYMLGPSSNSATNALIVKTGGFAELTKKIRFNNKKITFTEIGCYLSPTVVNTTTCPVRNKSNMIELVHIMANIRELTRSAAAAKARDSMAKSHYTHNHTNRVYNKTGMNDFFFGDVGVINVKNNGVARDFVYALGIECLTGDCAYYDDKTEPPVGKLPTKLLSDKTDPVSKATQWIINDLEKDFILVNKDEK
jgi:Beta-lactamase enzyme family